MAELTQALANLDVWLDSMRAPEGYTGPISHWWESNFLYTGALYDWRYEGIIDGYRELYLRTGEGRFLDKACRAADDIVPQLCPDGRFRNSSFQFGPIRGGTPHEAAIDVALLKLARTLKAEGKPFERYFETATMNLEAYWLGALWNGRGFQDQPYHDGLVPNKNGTAMEALLEYEALSGKDCSEYVEACARVIMREQIESGPQGGGIVHIGTGAPRLAIPIYTARALNGLLSYFEAGGNEEVLKSVRRALPFFERLIDERGIYWGVYGSGALCANPVVIAGAGDVLRYLERTARLGVADTETLTERLEQVLLAQQQPAGGLPTAYGFRKKGLSVPPKGEDLRDVLPVVGWVDKTFRALALRLEPGSTLPEPSVAPFEKEVFWHRAQGIFKETEASFSFTTNRGELLYEWDKGRAAPTVYKL